MSQAIHYIDKNSNQNATALSTSIPTQAVTIAADEVLNKTTLLTNLAHACDFTSYF